MNNKPVKATEKQLDFIRNIEDALKYDFDFKNGTKEEAQRYISSHIDEYNRYIDEHPMYFESEWAIANGYI